jgi:Ca2+-binding EF-hand superfamily protein
MRFGFPMSFDARSISMNAKRNLVATTVVLGAFVGFSSAGRAADDAPAGEKPEQLFKTLDKNADGKLTADEVGEDRKRFFDHLLRVADADKNGVLTADEFAKGLKDEPPVQAPPQRGGGEGRGDPAEFFKRLDVNGDDKITVDEVPEPAKRLVEGMLERAGKGKDGNLTREDFAKMALNARPGQPGQPGGEGRPQFGNPEEMFTRLDANGDGKITLDEVPDRAKTIVEQMLERAGKGKDGSISKEDYLKAVAQLRPGAGNPAGGAPGGPQFGNPEEMFKRMDANGDGKVTLDEVPERARPIIERMFEATGKGKDAGLTLDDFKKAGERFQQGANPQGARRPAEGGDRPRTEGDRPKSEGDRPRGDAGSPDGRRPEAGRPEGGPRGEGQGPVRPQALFFRKLDANGDGRLSKDEMAKASAVFDELDKNKDGELDPSELFGPPPEGFGGPGRPGQGADRRPEGARPEGSQRPDSDRRPESRPDAKPTDAKPADAEKSDKPAVRPAEAVRKREAAKKGDAKGATRGREAFEGMDKNGDGKISKDEATGRLKENFDRIDSNSDGFISTEEMQKSVRDLRKKAQ